MNDLLITLDTQEQPPDSLPFFSINIDGNLFLNPNLTDTEKTLIAISQTIRYQIMQEKNEERKKMLLDNLRVSVYARALNKHRDHVRRLLNKLQRSKAAQQYLTIHFGN